MSQRARPRVARVLKRRSKLSGHNALQTIPLRAGTAAAEYLTGNDRHRRQPAAGERLVGGSPARSETCFARKARVKSAPLVWPTALRPIAAVSAGRLDARNHALALVGSQYSLTSAFAATHSPAATEPRDRLVAKEIVRTEVASWRKQWSAMSADRPIWCRDRCVSRPVLELVRGSGTMWSWLASWLSVREGWVSSAQPTSASNTA